MTIKYKTSYLSDGTKVKITEELSHNLKSWEEQGYEIEDKFKDELKRQDNVWLNSHRQYYRNSSSLDAETKKENPNQSILLDSSQNVENTVMQNEKEQIICSILDKCTETQKRRFIKHYYIQLSYSTIAQQEGCTKRAVGNSIKSAEQMLIKFGNLL